MRSQGHGWRELAAWASVAMRRRLGLMLAIIVAVPVIALAASILGTGYAARVRAMVSPPAPVPVPEGLPLAQVKSKAVLEKASNRLAAKGTSITPEDLSDRLLVVQSRDESSAELIAKGGSPHEAARTVNAWAAAAVQVRRLQVRNAFRRAQERSRDAGSATSAIRKRVTLAGEAAAGPDLRIVTGAEPIGLSGVGWSSVLGGVLLAVAVAATLAVRDGRPRTAEAIRRRSGLPVLATLRAPREADSVAELLRAKLDVLGRPRGLVVTPLAGSEAAAGLLTRALPRAFDRARGEPVAITEQRPGFVPEAAGVAWVLVVLLGEGGEPESAGYETAGRRPTGLVLVDSA